jgi:hypothetical protein
LTSILGNVIIILPSKLVKGGFEMKKDEILEKAREEKKDEGIDNVNNKGLSLGHKIFILLSVFLLVFNKFNNIESYDVVSLMFVFSAARYYTEYKFSKELNSYYYLILSSFLGIVFLLCHIFLH